MAIASTQMSTNPTLSAFGIRVIAVVQDHELYVTKDGLNWVIIGAAFGQADPVQLQLTHNLTGLAGFAGMSTILIKSHPNGSVRIPRTEVT